MYNAYLRPTTVAVKPSKLLELTEISLSGSESKDQRRYTYLTPWSKFLIEKLIVTQIVKKFLAFYGTRRFRAGPQLNPNLTFMSSYLISSLILSSHPRIHLSTDFFRVPCPTGSETLCSSERKTDHITPHLLLYLHALHRSLCHGAE
jgi:hypothetical protein